MALTTWKTHYPKIKLPFRRSINFTRRLFIAVPTLTFPLKCRRYLTVFLFMKCINFFLPMFDSAPKRISWEQCQFFFAKRKILFWIWCELVNMWPIHRVVQKCCRFVNLYLENKITSSSNIYKKRMWLLKCKN